MKGPRPTRRASRVRLALLAALPVTAALGAAVAAPARAQIVLIDGQGTDLLLTGYVRSLTAGHDRGYPLGGAPERTGLHSEVLRVQWQLAGEAWRLDVHNRLQVRISDPAAATLGAGFGVSAVPGRSLDLSTTLVDEPGITVRHDIDRLSLTKRLGPADVTFGRQAVTWGVSTLFPVADLWTSFSPFELDTAEKPGIDAVRAFLYPAQRLELDLIVADRGRADDLSVGARATWGLPALDLWLGGGKLWRQVMAMAGVTVLGDRTRLRAEGVVPWSLDRDDAADPRATLGVDWIGARLNLVGEYHYNGIGAAGSDGYVRVLTDPRLARGETYYLGRHYLGGSVAWVPDDDARLNLTLSALVNLGDPSAAVTPLVAYDIGQAASLSLGALLSFGRPPDTAPPSPLPIPRSEFALYGDLIFTRLSLYF